MLGPDTYLVGSRREEIDEMDGSKTRLDDLGEGTARRHSRGEERQRVGQAVSRKSGDGYSRTAVMPASLHMAFLILVLSTSVTTWPLEQCLLVSLQSSTITAIAEKRHPTHAAPSSAAAPSSFQSYLAISFSLQ
jgi:hypothetical protein